MSWAFVGVAAFQVASGLANADATRKQGELEQSLADFNASFVDIDAHRAEQYGQTEEAAYSKQIDETIGTQRADLAAKNVDVSFGTSAELQAETRLTGFLNTLDIHQQAQQKAAGLRLEANNIRLQGAFGRMSNDTKAADQESQGFASAIQTGAKAYGDYKKPVSGYNRS